MIEVHCYSRPRKAATARAPEMMETFDSLENGVKGLNRHAKKYRYCELFVDKQFAASAINGKVYVVR